MDNQIVLFYIKKHYRVGKVKKKKKIVTVSLWMSLENIILVEGADHKECYSVIPDVSSSKVA